MHPSPEASTSERPPRAAARRASNKQFDVAAMTQDALLLDLWISLSQVQVVDEAADTFAAFAHLALPNLEQVVEYQMVEGGWLRECGGKGDNVKIPNNGLVAQALNLGCTLNIPPSEVRTTTGLAPLRADAFCPGRPSNRRPALLPSRTCSAR